MAKSGIIMGIGSASFEMAANYFEKKNRDSAKRDKTFKDQLKELNKFTS